MTSSGHLPPHNPPQRNQNHLHPPFGLWGHLSRHTGITQPNPPPSGNAKPSIAPLDKAGASTRILLHDTQAHLERFGERVMQLTTGVVDAKRELLVVQKLYQEDHEQLVERMIGLANRCQTELQKTIGTPAQSSELRDALKIVQGLGKRVEALDQKMDLLNMVGQTQSQALQTLQDQQGQIIAALLPLLPLLQAVPLHIENARNNVKEVVSDCKNDVKLWITGLEDRVKQSSETLGNQIRVFLPQGQAKEGVLALRPHVRDPVSDLQRHISTPVAAVSSPDGLARGTLRSRSASPKRPRSGSPGDTSSSDPATSPSDSKKRRLGNPSGRAGPPARSSRPLSGTSLGRIHTPIVLTTAPPSSSHASPDLPLLPAVVRSSDRLVRVPLADLDPRTPNATMNPGTPASIVSSVPKHQQLRGSRSTVQLHTRPSPAAPAIAPNRTLSTQSNKGQQARPLALAQAAPAGSTAHTRTPPPISTRAAPITPGTFKLPLPSLSLGPSRTSTTTTPQLQPRTTLNRHASSLRHPAVGDKPRSSSRAPEEPQPSHVHARSHTRTPGLAASRGVAVHDTPNGPGNGSRHVSRVGLPVRIGVGVGAGGATPRTPRLPADARSVAPPPPPLPPSAGKPMSLRDRRAMLAEDRLRDEGKRFIPLDDEEDEDAEVDADVGMAG